MKSSDYFWNFGVQIANSGLQKNIDAFMKIPKFAIAGISPA